MTSSRAAALHAFYTLARAEVLALRDTADPRVSLRLVRRFPGEPERRMVRQLCGLFGISYEERSALLALAGHPFTPSWAREMYGEMPGEHRNRRRESTCRA